MNTESTNSCLTILHEPYGERHPYEPFPWERTPHEPTNEDPVLLGVKVSHDPSADSVWCSWSIENQKIIHRVDAVKRFSDEMYDYWQTYLPPFEGNQTIHYRFFAQYYDEVITTDEFTFFVSAWETIHGMKIYQVSDEEIVMQMNTARDNLSIDLSIRSSSPPELTLGIIKSKTESIIQQEWEETQQRPYEMKGLRINIKDDLFTIDVQKKNRKLKLACTSMRILVGVGDCIEKYEISFESPRDEAFYGFGERFNALDQRGNRIINRIFAKYTQQGTQSYIPVPFFISSRGYGLWLKTEQRAEFDLAAADGDRWCLIGEAEEPNEDLQMVLFFQEKNFEIIRAFTNRTGKPLLPPPWAFGLWMSSNDWNSQQETLRQLKLSQQYEIPATVMVIEAWSDESNFYIWNDAQYAIKSPELPYQLGDFSFPPGGRWEDPKAMIAEIHKAGSHLVLWQIPVFKRAALEEKLDETQKNLDQEYARQRGYLVRNATGEPFLVEEHMPWFHGSMLIDFSNKEAVSWWFAKRNYLLQELGVDGFKTDGGEHIWDIHTKFASGITGKRGINLYPVLYERAYQHFIQNEDRKTRNGITDRVLFSRAGYTGIQKYSCHWTGDEKSSWNSFRATVRAMLNLEICGVSFVGWDIAGFAGVIPDSELYLRASAFSVFCPIMQFHSDGNARRKPSRDRTPWNIAERTGDESVIPIFRMFTNLRMNLLPYILSQAWQSSQSGIPLMRALFLEFPEDEKCKDFPFEYMFGEALLVAPVVEGGKTDIEIYLPDGEWQDIWSGKIYARPMHKSFPVPIDRIPVFQRKGSIVPLNVGEDGTLGSYVGNATDTYKNLVFRIFPHGDLKIPFYSGKDGSVSWISCSESMDEGKLTLEIPQFQEKIELILCGVSCQEIKLEQIVLLRNDARHNLNSWRLKPEDQTIHIVLAGNCTPCRLEIQTK